MYFFVFSTQCVSMMFGIGVSICKLIFMIECSDLFISMAKDIKIDLQSINAIKKNRPELMKRIAKFIRLRSKAKGLSSFVLIESHSTTCYSLFSLFYRLVSKFLDVYEYMIMSHLLWSVLAICDSLLLLQYGIVKYLYKSFN